MDRVVVKFIFDRKKEANNTTKQGLLQIEVRLIGTSKKVYTSTGIKLYKKQFSSKDNFTCKDHPNENSITKQGRDMFYKIQKYALSDKCKCIEDVKNWDKDELKTESFIDFIEKESRTENLGTSNLSNFNSMLSRLKSFGQIKIFSDLTYNNIHEFDAYLKKYIKSQPTLYKRHLQLRHYIKIAIKKGLYNYDPYNDMDLKKGKHKDPVYLTTDEIEKISNYDPQDSGIEKMSIVKDLFIFQCYTGLAYIDTQCFTKDDLIEVDGYKVIKSNRTKTDENFVCLLLPEAENIALKYDYSLPKINNQNYNAYLKTLASGAGIKKALTSHMGRHTFATYLLNKNIPIETVSRALGHTNIKQTEHYAKLLGKKVIADMSILLENNNLKNNSK